MDELLHYYDRELAYVRRLGARFAQEHPKIAGRLRLSEEHIEDPHVSRLIESFAFLTARIRHKIDDSFPEISAALLGTLYPDYQAPVPAMCITQLLSREEVTAPAQIKRGALIETALPDGSNCTFSVCYDTTVLPVSVTHAQLMSMPCNAPAFSSRDDYQAVLKLNLTCDISPADAAQLDISKLRFFIKGQAQHTYAAYELLFNHAVGLVIGSSDDSDQQVLPLSNLQPVGFEDDEAAVPYSNRTFPGYRLITEYFSLPEKFQFFDILNLKNITQRFGHEFSIYVYLDKNNTYLEQHLTKDNFLLGCTPVINLFPHSCDPVQITDADYEYKVVPDARRGNQLEVHTVSNVTAHDPQGLKQDYLPFYGVNAMGSQSTQPHWFARRESAEWAGGRPDDGSEVFVTLVSREFSREQLGKGWSLHVNSMCSNRNLPARLPFGEGQPQFHLVNGDPNVMAIRAVTQPTPTYRHSDEGNAHWQLTKLINLQQFSGENAHANLAETLRLFDITQVTENHHFLKGILSVRTENKTRRVRVGARTSVAYGTEFHVYLDESRFVGTGLFLFCQILDKFFAQYCTINSFTQLFAYRANNTLINSWAPRAGMQELA